jgi:hypothetical protein
MTEQHRCLHEGDLAELRTNMRAAFQRIDEQRAQGESLIKLTDSTHMLATNLAILTERFETMVEKMTKMETTIAEIQRIPVDDYRHYKRQWVGGTIMLVTGALIGALLQLIM